jgi:polyketide cyclase/dehydrase/lipid transport protein
MQLWRKRMPNQTVTRFIETDKSPEAVLSVLREPANITQWAPVFADTMERIDGQRYQVRKGEERFIVEVQVYEPAGCVNYIREMAEGNRSGAFLRVMPRPRGGSAVTMTVPVGPTTTEDKVAKVVSDELNELVRMAREATG